jgi:hypothetical protein
MNEKHVLSVVLLASFIMGCNLSAPAASPMIIPSETPTPEFIQSTVVVYASPTPDQPTMTVTISSPGTSTNQAVLNEAFTVVNALMDQDMTTLSRFVSPQHGLRFSPYAYLKDIDQLFPAEKVPGLMEDSRVLWWGNYDGSGEPINLKFSDYYAKFIYDENFTAAPQISLNHRLGTGNSIDNIQDFYPGSMVVEFYFPGFDAQYDGMDWRSLRLVFMQENNIWYLVGIIHDQWTI